MSKRIDLFVIDGQNDFLASGKEPADWPWPEGGRRPGSLCVAGADQEALKVAAMIDRLGGKIARIHATLDSHHLNDCSHNTAWKGPSGETPPPFTIVSHDDVTKQIWVPRFAVGVWQGAAIPSHQWALNYTKALADKGRNPLCLWPVHCEIGKWGQAVYHPLAQAYDRWAAKSNQWIDFISKGHWPYTEHYSAIRADVEDPARPETQMNVGVINDASNADIIVWAGWAGSHCLRWTALDAINSFSKTGTNPFIKKSVFLEDASAPVPNPPGGPDFVSWRKEFLDEVVRRGAEVTTTDKFMK